MNAILDFFASLADIIGGAVDFLLGLIADLVYIAQITAKAVSSIPGYFAFLPPEVIALLVTIFAIVVLYKIFGREG